MTPILKKLFFPFCFLLLNALGLWQGLRLWETHLQKRAEADPVLTESPADLKFLSGKEPVAWQWDRSVIAAEALGEIAGPAPVRISPQVPGVFRWMSVKQLQFTPAAPWPACRELEMEVQMLSTNARRQVFALRDLTRINGPPLEVTAVEPFLDPRKQELQVRLRLNAAVDLQTLGKYLTLFDPAGDRVELRVEETPSAGEFLLHAPWTGAQDGRLLVRSGLPPAGGAPGVLARNRSFPIRALDRDLRFPAADRGPPGPSDPPGPHPGGQRGKLSTQRRQETRPATQLAERTQRKSMSHTQTELDETIEMERLHLYNQGVPCGPKAIQARLAITEGAPAPSEHRIKKVRRERDLIYGWTRDYPREQLINR